MGLLDRLKSFFFRKKKQSCAQPVIMGIREGIGGRAEMYADLITHIRNNNYEGYYIIVGHTLKGLNTVSAPLLEAIDGMQRDNQCYRYGNAIIELVPAVAAIKLRGKSPKGALIEWFGEGQQTLYENDYYYLRSSIYRMNGALFQVLWD